MKKYSNALTVETKMRGACSSKHSTWHRSREELLENDIVGVQRHDVVFPLNVGGLLQEAERAMRMFRKRKYAATCSTSVGVNKVELCCKKVQGFFETANSIPQSSDAAVST